MIKHAWKKFWWVFMTPTGEFLGLPEYTRPRQPNYRKER